MNNELNPKELYDFINLYWQVIKKHIALDPNDKTQLNEYIKDAGEVIQSLKEKTVAFFYAGDCFASFLEYRNRVKGDFFNE